MLRQVELHSREFPDIRRLQTLVTRDAFATFSKLAKQMCGTDIYRAGSLHPQQLFISIFPFIFQLDKSSDTSAGCLHENKQQMDKQRD